MITFFRNLFKSKIGLAITFGFIALIALAFASAEVSGTGTFGGVSGGDRVAVVGDEKIGTAEFVSTANSALNQISRQNPTMTMRAFVEQDGLDGVLEQLIDRYAIAGYAREYGLRAGENLVNSEILQIPAFRGPDGNFSQDAYEAALRQQGLSDSMVRDDLGLGLLSDQLVTPATRGASLPMKFATQYAGLLRERRQGAIAFIPSAAFAPKGEPTDAQLQAFYDENRARYIRPERRIIRYATFGPDNLDSSVQATEAEIAARYEENRDEYAASEDRSFTQLIVPTKAAADTLAGRVRGGESIASVAQQAGFSTANIGPVNQQALAGTTSAAVAQATFAATQGGVAEPAQGSLGWYVIQVTNIERKPARTLAQVTPELRDQISQQKRVNALADLSARIEEQVDDGAPLAEVAADLELDIQTTKALTADGRVFGNPTETAPAELQAALSTAFEMQEGEPQLAEIARGERFLVFEVTEVTASATAPLNEIKQRVVAAWRLDEGAKGAKTASDRIMERLTGSATLAAAVQADEATLPPAESVNLNRQEIVGANGQVPPPLALMFSMATGTTKRLEASNDLGWFIVDLDAIEAQEIAPDDPAIAAAQQQLQAALSREYEQQLVNAMREEMGVETNQSAIDAVRRQLLGET